MKKRIVIFLLGLIAVCGFLFKQLKNVKDEMMSDSFNIDDEDNI